MSAGLHALAWLAVAAGLLLAAVKLLWPHRRLPAWRLAVVLIIGGAIVGTLVDGW